MGGGDRVLAVMLLAVATSVDGFAVGVSEGLRGIRVPASSLIVVNLVSAAVVFASLGSGRVVAGWLAPAAGRLIGAGILICLGVWRLRPGVRQARRGGPEKAGANAEGSALETEGHGIPPYRRNGVQDMECGQSGIPQRSGLMRNLMMVPRFLDEPARADLDLSGVLTAGEAFLLGLALAIDALGVGFGAGMAGLSAVLTSVVAGVTQYVFVSAGLRVGHRMKMSALGSKLERIPGAILILLGLLRLR